MGKNRLEYLLGKQEVCPLDTMEQWGLEQLIREGE
jgi:hypothetical protein